MAITLADAMENAATDVDYNVIDEFRKSDWLLDSLTFDDAVTPGTGGATLSYGYTRVETERAAGVRDYNDEGTEGEAKRTKVNVDLVPFNAPYRVDRALAHLGQRTTDEVAFQSSQSIKAVRAAFTSALIGGGRQTDSNGFDGLDAALAGSSTETYGPGVDPSANEFLDWSAVNSEAAAHDAMDALDELLGLLNGGADAILGNSKSIAKLRTIGRRAGYYERERDEFGRQVERYNGVPFVDLGAGAGTAASIIPVESRDVDAGGAGGSTTGLTDLYAVRLGMDALHGVATVGSPLIQSWLPDFATAGAVKPGDVELGPAAIALKATKAAAVLRNIKVA